MPIPAPSKRSQLIAAVYGGSLLVGFGLNGSTHYFNDIYEYILDPVDSQSSCRQLDAGYEEIAQ